MNDRSHLKLIRNPLSPTQTLLLQQLADGWTRRQIAEKRGISNETLKTHFKFIRKKTGKHTVLEAVVMCIRAGWIR